MVLILWKALWEVDFLTKGIVLYPFRKRYLAVRIFLLNRTHLLWTKLGNGNGRRGATVVPGCLDAPTRIRIRSPWTHSLALYRARQVAQIAINLWADLCRRPALASKIYRSPMTAAPKLAHSHRHLPLYCLLSVVRCPLPAVLCPLSAVGCPLEAVSLAFVSGYNFWCGWPAATSFPWPWVAVFKANIPRDVWPGYEGVPVSVCVNYRGLASRCRFCVTSVGN